MSDSKLRIELFGSFRMTYNDHRIGDGETNSPKLWNLLAYLITFSHKEISQNELIEIMWPDEGVQNPLNALKALIHRTRAELAQLGLDGKKMIIGHRGAYAWNCQGIDTDVDTKTFENFCHQAERSPDNQSKLSLLLSAIDLYQGDFLPNLSSERWVIPISAYYNSTYAKIVYKAITLLNKEQRYEESLALSKKAATILPYDELIHAYFIHALIKLGRYQLALNHYQQVVDMLYQQFSITPSEEFSSLYKEIVKQTHLEETSLSTITNQICEDNPRLGAYYCEPLIFQEICRYDARTKSRNGGTAFLALLSLKKEDVETLSQSLLTRSAQTLSATIHDSLRSGDCYSKFGVSQFAILLQNTTYEKGLMVLERVIHAYHRRNMGEHLNVVYSLEQLDPLKLPECYPQ